MKRYLAKHAYAGPWISAPPLQDLSLVVVIPVLDEPDLLQVFQDLHACHSLQGACEIIAVVNHAEHAAPETKASNVARYSEAVKWVAQHSHPRLQFHLIKAFDLPTKKAGVGLARKIGMDEAVRRFSNIGCPAGVMVCLDADCRVPTNYLQAIEAWFLLHSQKEGASIAFAHLLDDLSATQREAIVNYELHLRYFIGMQRLIGFPFAWQTIGSAMAVRADVYCQVGGMNMRQAGEDFYFLQKVIERGAFGEINTTCVLPSARTSDRVPFGTGRAMLNQLDNQLALETYHPQIFADLQTFFRIIPATRETSFTHLDFLFRHVLSPGVMTFLIEHDGPGRLAECASHTASAGAYQKRVYRWFNAFLLMKYVHFSRDQFYGTLQVHDAVRQYLRKQAISHVPHDAHALLLILRKLDGVPED